MSVHLAKMLGSPETEITNFIKQMEKKFGYPSHDVRLLAEVNQFVKAKIADLGLDPQDTSAEELYQTLQSKFANDALQIDKAIGIKPDTAFDSRIARAIEITKHIAGNSQVWALKSMSAKNLLISLPPKRLMRQLHYRSLESMFKHEDIGELYLLVPFVESSAWQNSFLKAAERLASNNYILSPVNFVHLLASRCGSFDGPTDFTICNKLIGSVGIWPSKHLSNAPVVTMVLMLLQSAQQLGVNIDNRALSMAHPALQWWSRAGHLISMHPEGLVSLNLADVAHNHLKNLSHKNATARHGAKTLRAELESLYQSLGAEIEDEIGKLMPPVLAAEYQGA